MKFLLSALLSAVTLAAAHNTLSSKEIFEGWILLFDGETTFGWTPEGKAEWRVADGVLVADAGESGYLRGNSAFADYVFRCDFRTGPEGNSGIFLRSAKEGQPHVTGYELQIFNQHPEWPTASLVNHRKAKSVQPAPDQWHTYEVTVSGDAFLVKLDGKKVLETRDSKSRLGHFGLQYNKDRKIEFRNIRLKPLGTKPIFNGKDLSG
ncbi:MAG: DUF1080 domain-containing protein, partial [Acidobacteria bacterium]|nr:DUF1080 domain-containing protein [Acidobacteriota bacterium]